MVPLMKIQGGIILVWLFILTAGVLLYRNECWTFLHATDSSLNCTCKPEVPNWLVYVMRKYKDNLFCEHLLGRELCLCELNLMGRIICLVPLAIISSCCIRMFISYYNNRDTICLPDGSSMSSLPPLPISDVNAVQNFELRILPSYSKAVGKLYQLPLDDPPAYEDIVMHSVSPPDTSILPVFMPKINTSVV